MPPPRGFPNFLEGPGDYDVTKDVHNDTYPAISPLGDPAPAHNKAVLVVGASRGLGISMAKSYAQAGASHIAIAARSSLTSQRDEVLSAAAAAKRPVPTVLTIQLDIADRKSTEDAAALVEKEFGRLDIVIINAAIFPALAKITDGDPEEWWQVLSVNLKGPYLISRAFLPLLLKGGDKTIITTSSVGAHLRTPTVSSYQTSKLAVVRLMEFVSAEYGDQGVVAYAIHPGNIPTDMTGGPEGLSEDMKPIFTESAELSADTLVFLTKEKRDWLAGRYINCTWDMPQLVAQKERIVAGDKLKVKLDF